MGAHEMQVVLREVQWSVGECGTGLENGPWLRIGGTTHLLLLGIDPWVIMVQGWWSSQAFLGYWRQFEEILPLFMGFHLQDHTSILMTMSLFKSRLLGS